MSYPIVVGDGRSTEALIESGGYGYAHSCLTSDIFPVRRLAGPPVRHLVLLAFPRELGSEEVLAAAAQRALARPVYEDAFYFGCAYPDAQRDGAIVFLHEPWLGFFGRRDVVLLWCNAGRREIGLEGFDARWPAGHRFAFVRPQGDDS